LVREAEIEKQAIHPRKETYAYGYEESGDPDFQLVTLFFLYLFT